MGGLEVASDTSQTDTAYIRDILTREIHDAEIIRLGDYERALLLVNDLPGVSIRSRLFPGTEVGTARISVELIETTAALASISTDNFGFHGFGAKRATATATLDNLAGEYESLAMGGSTSGKGQKYLFGELLVPVGPAGLTTKLIGSWFDYELIDDYASVEGSGNSWQLAAEISYPILRSTTKSTYLTGKLERGLHKDSQLGVPTSERTIDLVEVSLHGDFSSVTFAPAITTYAASIYAGNVHHDRGGDTFLTAGDFASLELRAEHLQNISGPFSWFTRVNAVTGTQNLEGILQCTVGGPFSNRGYAVGEGSADRCLTIGTDLRYDAAQLVVGADWQFAVFYDYTLGDQFHTTPAGQDNFDYNLSSVGLAANVSWPGRGFIHSSIGYQLTTSPGEKATGQSADFNSSDVRFWLQGVLFF